jgi:hypothetical protein
MKPAVLLCLASAALAQTDSTSTPTPRSRLRRRPPSDFIVKSHPYSAEDISEHTQTLTDGTHLKQIVRVVKRYRDSQGRTRTESTTSPDSKDPYRLTIVADPVTQDVWNLQAARHTAIKSQFPGIAASDNLTPDVGCPSDLSAYNVPDLDTKATCEALGTKDIDGIAAVGAKVTIVLPVGALGNDRPIASITETWVSPDLKVIVLSKVTDPRLGETVRHLTHLSRDEPDPALFRVPDDYRITSAP